MSTGTQAVRDLVEEAKKRIMLLSLCVFGLSYLMSLTSSSVWINLPIAAALVVLFHYVSFDLEMRRRATVYKRPLSSSNLHRKKPFETPKVIDTTNWRRKVNSPFVEAAIEQFSRHLVSEWVTDLWYSHLSSDRNGPEELVQIMNDIFGEVSFRVRDTNLIDLLSRDFINLISNHLELYRACQAKIGKQSDKQSVDERDIQFKLVLASEDKLHPALFSAESEHKVLQHLMGGLISFTFKPEDLQCSFFHFTARELLACAVMRPVLDLANPRFLNERIESLVLSFSHKAESGVTSLTQDASQFKTSSRTSSDHLTGLDCSDKGLELVQFKHEHPRIASGEPVGKNANGTSHLKGPAHSGNSETLRSTSSLPSHSHIGYGNDILSQRPSGRWAQILDLISQKKIRALAPEHFENVWAKGRNYREEILNESSKKVVQISTTEFLHSSNHLKVSLKNNIQDGTANVDLSRRNTYYPQHKAPDILENLYLHIDGNTTQPMVASYQEKTEHDTTHSEADELKRDSSNPTEEEEEDEDDDDSSNITGLDSPVTKVWDSKSNRNTAVSHIWHPLESSEEHLPKKSGKSRVCYQNLSEAHSGRKRSSPNNQKAPIWKELDTTTSLLEDGREVLNSLKNDKKGEELGDKVLSVGETRGRVYDGESASSTPTMSLSEDLCSYLESSKNSLLADPFLKLRCKVLGANIVESGSRTFAVYSISVADADSNTWSIKRRFRHFEELHRHLKEFPVYNLSLPPKHFLSSGLGVPLVQERCKLLDMYLKNLLQLPTISESIEVWDFLSVDSQTYMFSDCLSIIETLSVDQDVTPYKKCTNVASVSETTNDQYFSEGEHLSTGGTESSFDMKQNSVSDLSNLKSEGIPEGFLGKDFGEESKKLCEDYSGRDTENGLQKNVSSQLPFEAATDQTLPTQWVPSNLSIPLLDLVDVLFQLQDGGWIRRQAFWVAKQALQLGMGDAFDDWLIEKIQLLRQESVIVSAIKRVEQILWPDGIFLTKHPKRQHPLPPEVQSHNASRKGEVQGSKRNAQDVQVNEEEEFEAARREKFVYELLIDNAPAALIGLVGHKEYEQCVKDLYFFIQSPLCLKQLAFGLLELLLLSAFPELSDIVKQCHVDKERFLVQLKQNIHT